jgi:nucleoid DNA-binding protein
MTHLEVIKKLSIRLGVSQSETKKLLNSSTQMIKKLLDEDFGITVPGFGSFKTQIRQKRKSYNPQTKKFMILPPKRIVTYHPYSSIKDALKEKKVKNEE